MRNIFSLVLLVTALAASGCGDSPTKPSAPAAPVPPAAPEVKIVTVGVIYTVPTYRGANNVPVYLIDGVGQNVGAGCVSEITGTTTIEGVSVSWAVARPVTSGSQFWYTAKLELPNTRLAARVVNYTTTFKAKSGC